MKYKYVFTDGLDKLLSASIFLPDYGGDNAFVYYKEGKLKGYILDQNFKTLSDKGFLFFSSESNIKWLLSESSKTEVLIDEFINENQITPNLKEKISELSALLGKAYSLYFYTEEFNTTQLSLEHQSELIKNIGEYRLNFINCCIRATKKVNELAELQARQYKLDKGDIQFVTLEELLKADKNSFKEIKIGIRKESFLYHKIGNEYFLFEGKEAEEKYKELTGGELSNKRVRSIAGMGASPGVVKGAVFILSLTEQNIASEIARMPEGSVLVTESTQPALTLACNKAAAIVTNEGGVLSHAAIISRELNIPCVVGTENATEILKTGQEVRVDGTIGVVDIVN